MNRSQDIETIVGKEASAPRVRYDYLEGLRGLCALFVVIGHAGVPDMTRESGLLARLIEAVGKLLPYANFSVSVFIVLSGYCLMIPVAKSAEGQLRGGVWGFFRRRAWRILPPYYAAIVLSLLIIAATGPFRAPDDPRWQVFLPAFTPTAILTHIVLIHNLHPDWIFKINGPMWSVATEAQIYILFPALLLPVWRRLGLVATVLTGMFVGTAIYFSNKAQLAAAHPWYLGLFAMGMAGAVIGFTATERLQSLRERLPWGTLAAGLALLFFGAYEAARWRHPAAPLLSHYPYWIMEPLIGAATTCLLIFCTRHLTNRATEPRPAALRFMEWRPVLALGAFSYSLYLMHFPILEAAFLVLNRLPPNPYLQVGLVWGAVIPFILFVTWRFYLVFERPFVSEFMKAKPTPRLSAL